MELGGVFMMNNLLTQFPNSFISNILLPSLNPMRGRQKEGDIARLWNQALEE